MTTTMIYDDDGDNDDDGDGDADIPGDRRPPHLMSLLAFTFVLITYVHNIHNMKPICKLSHSQFTD